MAESAIKATTIVDPRKVSQLILRLRALIKKLVPVEVSQDSLTQPDGLINHAVVASFVEAGGDLRDVTPFALLEAKTLFESDRADGELNNLRGQACEILARRVVYQLFKSGYDDETTFVCLSKRFCYIDARGNKTLATSALESAVDQSSITFLSSPEAQACIDAIWTGKLVQSYSDGQHLVHFVPWQPKHNSNSLFDYFEPARLAVPRFNYSVSLVSWLILLGVYSIATQTYSGLDGWEIALWLMLAGYIIDDLNRWWKVRGLEALSIWLIIDVLQDILATVAFAVRVVSFIYEDVDHSTKYQRLAFQLLACLAPFLWMQLLKATDVFKFFGLILQSLVGMLQETGIFLVLLVLVGIGFAQALYSLDAADGGRTENATHAIVQTLLSGLLGGGQSLDIIEEFGQPFSEILLYAYSLIQVLFLTNILVALLNNAYSDLVADADDAFGAYFATKTIGLVRAPDQYVYPAPLNLLELFLIAPLEFVLSKRWYQALNRAVQTVLFSLPLMAIAVFEWKMGPKSVGAIRLEMLEDAGDCVAESRGAEQVDSRAQAIAAAIGAQSIEDPDDGEQGTNGQRRDGEAMTTADGEREAAALTISRVSFQKLTATFPAVVGGTEDDADQDPTTGEVAVKKEDDGAEAMTGQLTKGSSSGGSDSLLRELLDEVRSLRSELESMKKETKKSEA